MLVSNPVMNTESSIKALALYDITVSAEELLWFCN